MVRIPAGTFVMGLTGEQAQEFCRPEWASCNPQGWPQIQEASPSHEVTLAHDYWMDVYEVTNAQYLGCENAGVCRPPGDAWIFGPDEVYYGNPAYNNYPVLAVSWTDAAVFCQEWRGGRLPTEAEWEYAARGTDGRLRPWGDAELTLSLANYLPNEDDDDWPGLDGPVPVGSFPDGVSPFGLYDMVGNAYEWVADRYVQYIEESCVDPVASEGSERIPCRVERGGSYLYWSMEATAVIRGSARQDFQLADTGIRCVRDVSP